jgi:hypothetical protein
VIRLLLSGWRALSDSADPEAIVERLRQGHAPSLPSPPSAEAQDAVRTIAMLGGPAVEALEALAAPSLGATSARAGEFATGCAGLFLLVRAILDGPIRGTAPPVLAALGTLWSGPAGWCGDQLDAGLALWAGFPPEPVAPEKLLGRLDDGVASTVLEAVETFIHQRRAIDPAMADLSTPDEWITAVSQAWPAHLPLPKALAVAAIHLLRAWARWLPGIGQSSPPYLLRQFIRRTGRIHAGNRSIRVSLRPEPLDIVLEMAGYTREIAAVPWLDNRDVAFHIDRGAS